MRLNAVTIPNSHDERSIGDLVRELREDALHLLRQELRLFRVELKENARNLAGNGLLLIVGGFVMLMAVQALVLAASLGLIILLNLALPLEASIVLGPTIVCLVLAAIGWSVMRVGIHRLKCAKLWPQRSVEAAKETRQWIAQGTTT